MAKSKSLPPLFTPSPDVAAALIEQSLAAERQGALPRGTTAARWDSIVRILSEGPSNARRTGRPRREFSLMILAELARHVSAEVEKIRQHMRIAEADADETIDDFRG